MNTFRYMKCRDAVMYSVAGSPGPCYEKKEFSLPDGGKIVFDGKRVVINGEEVTLKYIGSYTYSEVLKKPLVRMLYAYPMKGVIIPDKKFAFLHIDTSFGPVTVAMYPDATFVGVDTLVTITKIREVMDPSKVYALQFIGEVEEKYFNREEFKKYMKGVV